MNPPQQPQQQPLQTPPNFTPNETLRPLFDAVDLDKSGKISYHELQRVLTMPGSDIHAVFSERCAKRLIKMFDRNGNGSIDFEEYSALHQYLIQMKQGFESVDLNKSGKLEKSEIATTLTRVGFNFSPQLLDKLFHVFDFQSKGSLNFDGYIELCAFLGIIRNQFIPKDVHFCGQATFSWEQFVSACMEVYM
nr:unnamed protein product [Naegleria fowleri]